MGALTLREQAVEKAAYRRGWQDRESDFMAGVDRAGMAVVSPAEAATLASLRPGPNGEPATHVAIPRAALDWLNGLGDSFELQPGQKGAFWWRSEFRRRCEAAAQEPPRDDR